MEIKDIKQCLNQIKESQEILKAIYTFFIKHNPQKADESFVCYCILSWNMPKKA